MRSSYRWTGAMLTCLALSSCASHQVTLAPEAGAGEQTVEYVKALDFTGDGLPVFTNTMYSKPRRTGAHYFQVLYEHSKPRAAYLVGVVGEDKADWSRPFATVVHWSGKGFDVGARFMDHMVNTGCDHGEWWRDVGDVFGEFVGCAAIGLFGAVVAGTGGFVIGAAASIPEFATELQHSIDPTRERLLMVMRLTYDPAGRMTSYTFELPHGRSGQQLVTTHCRYDGDAARPRDCRVESTPERITRKTGYGL